MSATIQQVVEQLNQTRRRAWMCVIALRVLRAAFMGVALLMLWAWLHPGAQWEPFWMGFLTFIAVMAFSSKRHSKPIFLDDFMMAMEIRYPEVKVPPFRLRYPNVEPSTQELWDPILAAEVNQYRHYEIKRLGYLAGSLAMPLLALIFAAALGTGSVSLVIKNMAQVMAQFTHGVTLTVVEGNVDKTTEYSLRSGRPIEITLHAENMIAIKAIDDPDRAPTIELRRRQAGKDFSDLEPHPYQSFQLFQDRSHSSETTGVYDVSFAVTDDVALFVPSVSGSQPLAYIRVEQLPIPKVRLEVDGEKRTPWPDDRPLPLKINVSAENPLSVVQLKIRSGTQEFTEVVNNVLAQDLKELATKYSVVLESYVETDQAQVEIVAEAVDRSVPNPLVGRSQPIVVDVVSAYGRYQQTLATLRELKTIVDDWVKTGQSKDWEKAQELVTKGTQQSQDSPFFDGLDRVNISRFDLAVADLKKDFNTEKVFEFSRSLDSFLFEHEALNDRERDRDFFVAARALSRLIEKPHDKRSVQLERVIGRMKTYLDERQARWVVRVERVRTKPKRWEKVRQKYFHLQMDKINRIDAEKGDEGREPALTELSATVAYYREWIEELEEAEEKQRESQEKERQQGLANAQNVLRELQKRQGAISTKLDHAETRDKQEMDNQWPATRLDQNTNTEATRQLEAQLRSLSPQAGERVKVAIEAMEQTVAAGNGQEFSQAESSSDLAGRMLRQAESAASRSRDQQQRRGRRRQVTGDNYFGSQVTGGDVEIKHNYEVNRRYREEVLEDVRRTRQQQDSNSDDQLLENYLRKVVR